MPKFLLYPELNWQWQFNQTLDRLELCGDETSVVTAFRAKSLIPDAKLKQPFAIQHAEDFINWQDNLAAMADIEEKEMLAILINLLAAKYLTLPVMPKNWLFKAPITYLPVAGEKLARLISATGDSARFFIYQLESDYCQVMLLDQTFDCQDKQFKQFAIFKVAKQLVSLEPC